MKFFRDCLTFCFMDLIRQDLNKFKVEWNSHRLRPSEGARCPAGRPSVLFDVPEAYGMLEECFQLFSFFTTYISNPTVTHGSLIGINNIILLHLVYIECLFFKEVLICGIGYCTSCNGNFVNIITIVFNIEKLIRKLEHLIFNRWNAYIY